MAFKIGDKFKVLKTEMYVKDAVVELVDFLDSEQGFFKLIQGEQNMLKGCEELCEDYCLLEKIDN